ncbi:nuclear transport factor 2 family protein [Paramixta manurensis]|uniref:Nuclear transport factor 2 family protein n=1 Tax=Paramixta manurensis TaxID=2740817 RepID=A0A6M8U6H5_9GAMM|nr:nuclear transport factor 2 family protein [Erwiniaceae bacterium PD-1]
MCTTPSVIEKFVQYYAGLDTQSPSALDCLYDTDAILIDPFGAYHGLAAIQRYFTHLLASVAYCRFSIDPPFCDGSRFAMTWTMHWSHPKIAGGEALSLPGCSVAEIRDDLIIRQRDYYDAGEMLYEHLPLLGWAVRSVKKRVSA